MPDPTDTAAAAAGPSLPDDHLVKDGDVVATNASPEELAAIRAEIDRPLTDAELERIGDGLGQDLAGTEHVQVLEAGKVLYDHRAEAAELERLGKEIGPQHVTVRGRDDALHVGVVIQRFAGGYECMRLTPRHAREIELKPGDQVYVMTLVGRNLREFEAADAANKEAAKRAADAVGRDA